MLKRSLKDFKKIAKESYNIIPKTIENISQYGFTSAFAKTVTNDTMKKDLKNSLENLKEMLDLIEVSYEKTYAKIKHL